MQRKVIGVAIIGNTNRFRHIKFYRKLYICWYNMISRCYNKTDKCYKYYGGNGVTVNDRWMVFENFFEDSSIISGWNEQNYISGNIVLDKDFLCEKLSIFPKIYSKETCMWITNEHNVALRNSNKQISQKNFFAISPSGVTYISNNQSEFARTKFLNRKHINDCLNKRAEHHRGWKFEYCDKENRSED